MITKKATGYEVVFTVSTQTAITGSALAVTIPAGLTEISGVVTTGSYGSPTWTIGAMAVNDSETLTLLFNPADLSLAPQDVTALLTYVEILPDTADDTITRTVDIQVDKTVFPVRTLTDTDSPHSVLVGIDSAIKLDGTSGAVNLLLGDAAGWLYADGSSFELKVNCNNAASAVTVDGGADNIVDDVGVGALTLALTAGQSAIIGSNGTVFEVLISGGAI